MEVRKSQLALYPPPKKTLIIKITLEKKALDKAALIKFLISKGYQGVYISFENSYAQACQILSSVGLGFDKLFFIDCISSVYGICKADSSRVSYVKGPMALGEITKQLKTSLSQIKTKHKFVFVDSLNCLMIYNQINSLVEFIQTLNDLIRDENCLILVLSLDSQNYGDPITSFLEKQTAQIDSVNFS